MKITSDFNGGNIKVLKINGNTVHLDTDMRDSSGNWFYWAFAVEGAEGETLSFLFPENRVGYFGPAVSRDLCHWEWLGEKTGEEQFSYSFGADEDRVYFAHHILYPECRIENLVGEYGIDKQVLCKGRRGSDVPLLKFGDGGTKILLTARHHCCESTGSYVLEGIIRELCEQPSEELSVFAVPFVDYDGYKDGDQGKNRRPHDHNRDYSADASIYPETNAIKKLARAEGMRFAFDFHSPWHKGGRNDYAFIVQKSGVDELNRFAALFEESLTEGAFRYDASNDLAPGVEWNNPESPTFANYMKNEVGAEMAFTLETAYFGEPDNIASVEKYVELGRSFAKAIKKYIEG